MTVDIFGPEDAPAVVFLHGAGSNRKMWASYESGVYRAIVPDLPGHGSERATRFTLDGAVDAVAEVIDRHAAGRAVVCGSSLGGYVGIALAARHPDQVSALVLSGATASYLGWGGFTTRLSGLVMRLVGSRLLGKAEQSLRSGVAAEIVEPILAEGLDMRGAADALVRLPGRDFHAMLASFVGPVLVLNGERDTVNRKEEDRATSRLPDVKVETLPDSGHACVVTQPGAFQESVERYVASLSIPDTGG